MLTTNFAEKAADDAAVYVPPQVKDVRDRPVDLSAHLAELEARHRRRTHIRLSAFILDIIAIKLAFCIAGLIRFGTPFENQVAELIAVMLPVYLVVAINQRAFHMSELLQARRGAANAVVAFIISLCVVGLVVFFLKVSADFSRAVFGMGALLSLILIPFARFCLAQLSRRHMGDTMLNEVVIEDGEVVEARPGQIVLCASRDGLAPDLYDPAMLDRLGQCARYADRVIVACRPDRRPLWAMALKGADVNAEVLAPELDELGVLGVAQHHGRSTLLVASGPLRLLDRGMKRGLDLVLVFLAMPFCLPVMLLVALAIRVESKGPILFCQQRVGLGNRMFTLYKFRSMYCDRLDGAGHRSTGRSDDRITRVGRFIRKTSLDELPQIFNVLFGTMSIVGPRPHALGSRAEERLFWDIDLAYWHRHAVKPGMTGLAQIRGYRGATERLDDLRNRLEADLQYVTGWTIWRDVRIILATFRVLIHKNAF